MIKIELVPEFAEHSILPLLEKLHHHESLTHIEHVRVHLLKEAIEAGLEEHKKKGKK